MTRPQGRRAWVREGRRALDGAARARGAPDPADRGDRLFEASGAWRRSLRSSTPRNAAYERVARAGVMRRRRGGWRRGWSSRTCRRWCPTGKINTTDPDSRLMRTRASRRCRATTRRWPSTSSRSSIAAEITSDSPDFGHLEPMVGAAPARAAAGRSHRATRDVVLADAGYWHSARWRRSSATASRSWSRPTAGHAQRRPARMGRRALRVHAPRARHRRTAARSTASAKPRSSPCSARSSSTAGSTASNDEAEPPCARNGD